jgi:hypothetical protein
MSNNPTATLTRPQVQFCLATHIDPDTGDQLICTRRDQHDEHCCDEVTGKSWHLRTKKPITCPQHYDHSAEKGLCR